MQTPECYYQVCNRFNVTYRSGNRPRTRKEFLYLANPVKALRCTPALDIDHRLAHALAQPKGVLSRAGMASSACASEQWELVRHVRPVQNNGLERRSLRAGLSAVLLIPSVVLLLSSSSTQPKGTMLANKIEQVREITAMQGRQGKGHSAIQAAEEAGMVQAVRKQSKINVAHNVLAHALASAPASLAPQAHPQAPLPLQQGPRAAHFAMQAPAPKGKLIAGKSSADVKSAAIAAVKTHMLDEEPSAAVPAAAESAAAEPAAAEDFAKEPNHENDAPVAQIEEVGTKFAATQLLDTGTDNNDKKVLVKMYMESECPACRKFATTYLSDIVNAPGMLDIMDIEFIPFGFAKIYRPLTPEELKVDPSGSQQENLLNHTSQLLTMLDKFNQPWEPEPQMRTLCHHGEDECEGNGWETCLQDIVPSPKDFLPVFHCMESRSCAEGLKPPDCVGKPNDVVVGCVQEFGQGRVDVNQLVQCYRGTRVQELMILNDIATLDANIQWAPWFTIDGTDLIEDPNNTNETQSYRKQFLLGKKICDTYAKKTGKEPPKACATFPQKDADIPAVVYESYPKEDFTSYLKDLKKQQALQAQEQAAAANAAKPSFFNTIT